jgi:four helix bundle protein
VSRPFFVWGCGEWVSRLTVRLLALRMRDYTRLVVWQKSRVLSVAVYEVAGAFPNRVPGLRSQLVRAVMSIGANIAEGCGRDSRADYARFLSIAAGSSSEVVHHLVTASDLGLIEAGLAARLVDQTVEIRRMLFGLRRAVLARGSEDK